MYKLKAEYPFIIFEKTKGNICIEVLKRTKIIKIIEFFPTVDPCQNSNLFKDLKLAIEKSLFYDA